MINTDSPEKAFGVACEIRSPGKEFRPRPAPQGLNRVASVQ